MKSCKVPVSIHKQTAPLSSAARDDVQEVVTWKLSGPATSRTTSLPYVPPIVLSRHSFALKHALKDSVLGRRSALTTEECSELIRNKCSLAAAQNEVVQLQFELQKLKSKKLKLEHDLIKKYLEVRQNKQYLTKPKQQKVLSKKKTLATKTQLNRQPVCGILTSNTTCKETSRILVSSTSMQNDTAISKAPLTTAKQNILSAAQTGVLISKPDVPTAIVQAPTPLKSIQVNLGRYLQGKVNANPTKTEMVRRNIPPATNTVSSIEVPKNRTLASVPNVLPMPKTTTTVINLVQLDQTRSTPPTVDVNRKITITTNSRTIPSSQSKQSLTALLRQNYPIAPKSTMPTKDNGLPILVQSSLTVDGTVAATAGLKANTTTTSSPGSVHTNNKLPQAMVSGSKAWTATSTKHISTISVPTPNGIISVKLPVPLTLTEVDGKNVFKILPQSGMSQPVTSLSAAAASKITVDQNNKENNSNIENTVKMQKLASFATLDKASTLEQQLQQKTNRNVKSKRSIRKNNATSMPSCRSGKTELGGQPRKQTDNEGVDLSLFEQFKLKPLVTCTTASEEVDVKPNLTDLQQNPQSQTAVPVSMAQQRFVVMESELLQTFIDLKNQSGYEKSPDEDFLKHLLTQEKSKYQTATDGVTEGGSRNYQTSQTTSSAKNMEELMFGSKMVQCSKVEEDTFFDQIECNSSPAFDEQDHSQAEEISGFSGKRHASVSNEELMELQIAGKKMRKESMALSQITKKQMSWAVSVLKDWLKEKGLDPHFEDQSAAWLNNKLERFYVEVRTLDGMPYSANALQQFKQSMSWYLAGAPFFRQIHLNFDQEFETSNQVLAAVIKSRKDTNQEVRYSIPISREDFQKLYSSGVLSDKNPVTLSWKVWFEITYYICRGRMSKGYHRNLKKTDLVLMCDARGVYYTLPENAIQGIKNEVPGKMYATPFNRERCPVRTTNLYLQKLCAGCDAMFQYPRRGWKTADDRWFHPLPMGHNKLARMMSIISNAAELSRVYTNSSVISTARAHQQFKNWVGEGEQLQF